MTNSDKNTFSTCKPFQSYAINRAKDRVRQIVRDNLEKDVEVTIEYPPPEIEADLAIPCFPYARILKKAPAKISQEIAQKTELKKDDFIEKIESVGGYLNFFLNKNRLLKEVFTDFENYGQEYGSSNVGKGKTMVIDYSSPNLAKPFSVGNVRSTIIGQAIYNIYKTLGYRVIGINHLGDWGTQFGKLIYACQRWGVAERIEKNPTRELYLLYVRFHEESEEHPEIEEEARKYFKRLESGDPEIKKIWEKLVQLSMEELKRTYHKLGIEFDLYLGESFYNDKTSEAIQLVEKSGIAKRDEDGALLVPLEEYGISTPLLLQKSDGATLYATREIASLLYRMKEFEPDLLIYVVGGEQKLHFQQCFKVLELLGFDVQAVHVDFGLVSLKDGKMSTRQGRVIFLEDLLKESYDRVMQILDEKRPDLTPEEKVHIAEVVGYGAIIFNDLSQNRIKNVVFDWDRMLSFDGDTAPYLQYSYARTRSILRKADVEPQYIPLLLTEQREIDLVKSLARFPEYIRTAAENFAPHFIAQYLLDISKQFSAFYQEIPVLKAGDKELVKARLGLIKAYSMVIKEGLSLLGIEVLERM